jgi:pimeloyl-ACP methyl ester carboxylesterase
MATFLLVHGAWHGAWCWERVAARLRDAGHAVVAPDLPALGADRTPWWRATLRGYARAARDAARPAGRVIAVGHSLGGAVLTQAAADEPALFAGLVYVCAFAPRDGESPMALGRTDAASRVFEAARFGFGRVAIRPERAAEAFYNACRPDDARAAAERLVPMPLLPCVQRVARPGALGVPLGYVECTEDRAISLDLQRRMHRRFRMERVATLDADHSPFLCAPDALAAELVAMAEAFAAA